jgi:hypothetical protein
MNHSQLYDAWKENKSQIYISKDFTSKVMSQIYEYEKSKIKPFEALRWIASVLSSHPAAQAGLVATSGIVGFVRIALVMSILLQC